MTTLQTGIEVTEECRLRLDMRLPEDLPIGYADVEIYEEPAGLIMDFFGAFKGERWRITNS